jgi:hypothetical protein
MKIKKFQKSWLFLQLAEEMGAKATNYYSTFVQVIFVGNPK